MKKILLIIFSTIALTSYSFSLVVPSCPTGQYRTNTGDWWKNGYDSSRYLGYQGDPRQWFSNYYFYTQDLWRNAYDDY